MQKENRQKQWWEELLRCPVCHKILIAQNQCSDGHKFEAEDGTPRFVPIDFSTEVTFTFNSARSFMSEEALLEVFEDPVQPDAAGLP